ncbi:MAG TPA: dUTP diphosphatase [Candidatus Baltobacteraceae bacterium]|jgi:dUTP pyrophosphatase
MRVRVTRLAHAAGLPLPKYASKDAAGADVCAALEADLVLRPGARAAVPTGLCVEFPQGYEMQVRPRSGLALRDGIGLLNSPGTIDADYRGEIKIILVNHGNQDVLVKRGDRIAQLVLAPVVTGIFEDAATLAPSERGEAGFGSTGVRE